ncbi:zinc finger protein 436 [Aedes albopictus]|uniref:C2h2-type zn-finger protein n=1 Tax=Aedes albopictus TaxID=7160 RepID=A0ABM1Y630_AEDAL|nr:zinc finger protein 436 [Aedes albopictus]
MDIVPESCRLCLSASEPTSPIYERLTLAEITELLHETLGIQISNSEEYANICNGCEMKVKLMYTIYNEFRQADKLFCSFLDTKRSEMALIEEDKTSIRIVTVLPLETLEEDKLEVECEFTTEATDDDKESKPVQRTKTLAISKQEYDDSDDEDYVDVTFPDPDYSSEEDEKPSTSKLLTCHICKEFSGTKRALETHLQNVHGSLLPYYCDRCLVGFDDDLMAVNFHYQSHELPFGCLFCEDLFSTEEELDIHNKSCVGYQCSHCQGYFQLVQYLKDHDCKSSKHQRVRVLTGMVGSLRNLNRYIPHVCGMCNENMGKNDRLAYHFEREHNNCQLQLFSCDICPKKFTMLLAARLHRISHKTSIGKQRKQVVQERNECTICTREFRFNKELLAHIEAEHAESGMEFHQCGKCERKFTSEAKLQKHDYNTHQGKQPQFFCSFCGRVFNKKLGLKDHENLHRGITEYHCKECNKNFTYKSTYDRHMQVVHSDTKQFTCEYCHKSFKRKPTLKVHLRLHTGEKPYQCEYCSRRFVDPSSFHKHKTKEHGWKSSYHT